MRPARAPASSAITCLSHKCADLLPRTFVPVALERGTAISVVIAAAQMPRRPLGNCDDDVPAQLDHSLAFPCNVENLPLPAYGRVNFPAGVDTVTSPST